MSGARTILILDDEPGIRAAMSKGLAMSGHRTHAAATLPQAEEIARREPIEILLTDLRLAGDDGVQAIAAIRRIRPQVRAVVMTGFGSLESAVQALRLGAMDYLTKPFRLEDLRAAIARYRPAADEPAFPRIGLPWERSIPSTEEGIFGALGEASAVLRNAGLDEGLRTRVLGGIAEAAGNAARHAYGSSSGPIRFALHREGARLTARVDDQGIGFPAGEVLARALTRKDARTGLRFLQECCDDLRLHSGPGTGCRVDLEFQIPEERIVGWLRLPSIPGGAAWEDALSQVRDAQGDLRLDFSAVELLTPRSASSLRGAAEEARRRGFRVSFENVRLAHPASSLLTGTAGAPEAAEDPVRVRQALWA